MDLPSPEVCQQLLAFHVLLGYSQPTDEGRDERRKELLNLLAEHGLKWSDWPAFFAAQNIVPSQPLPPVDSPKWKHCEKARQLHSAMGSADKDAAVAHKKLIAEVAKQKFIWSSDLPAILAAHWIHHNPSATSTGSAAPTGMPDDFSVLDFLRALFDDYSVLSEAQRLVLALWTLHTHVFDNFEYTPRLALISPDSGYGKTRIMRLLKQLVAESKLSKMSAAPYAHRERERQGQRSRVRR